MKALSLIRPAKCKGEAAKKPLTSLQSLPHWSGVLRLIAKACERKEREEEKGAAAPAARGRTRPPVGSRPCTVARPLTALSLCRGIPRHTQRRPFCYLDAFIFAVACMLQLLATCGSTVVWTGVQHCPPYRNRPPAGRETLCWLARQGMHERMVPSLPSVGWIKKNEVQGGRSIIPCVSPLASCGVHHSLSHLSCI